MIIALLWTLAFIVPAFAVGIPIPHAPYVLIPVLAMSAGLSDRHAFRRVIVWAGLVALYELIYHVPAGMLVGPVLFMTLMHVIVARVIRVESGSERQQLSMSTIIRSVIGLLAWTGGLVMCSVLWGAVFHGTGNISSDALYTVWWHNGAAVITLFGLTVTSLFLRAERMRRVRTVFSDHAVLQTHNLPN